MQFFITGDRPNVAGLVLAGSAEFKSELSESDMFDQRLKAAVLAVVDVSYGASVPFFQPIFWMHPSREMPLSLSQPAV